MKIIIINLLISLMFVLPSFAGNIEFPFTLTGPGKYNLEVPKNDSWKIFNEKAWSKEQLQYAKLKLELEAKDATCQVELTYIKDTNILKINNLTDVFKIKENYNNDKIKTLEDRNKKLQKSASGTFLGISKSTFWFAFGAFAMAFATK